jgi:hypothetical protein
MLHQPGSGAPAGADHLVVVTAVNDETVLFHDPDGHPFAALPIEAFLAAWRAETIGYATGSYVMRTGFRRVRPVDIRAALRQSLPAAASWLDAQTGAGPASSGLGGRAAVGRLAGQIATGLADGIRDHLVYFAVRVGARRLADASFWLAEVGDTAAAVICQRQARLVGSLQYDLVAGNTGDAVQTLHRLAPTYQDLRAALTPAAAR